MMFLLKKNFAADKNPVRTDHGETYAFINTSIFFSVNQIVYVSFICLSLDVNDLGILYTGLIL